MCAAQAKPTMVKSTVVDNETGKSIDSTVRTSTGTFFPRQARPGSHGQPQLSCPSAAEPALRIQHPADCGSCL